MKNGIRIWIHWRDGIARITVPFNGEVLIGYGGPTDEGWSRHWETFTHDENDAVIKMVSVDDGCDCDGRLTHTISQYWKVGGKTMPMCKWYDDDGRIVQCRERRPVWQDEYREQVDQSAELAGY
jgi:hypothetical protein